MYTASGQVIKAARPDDHCGRRASRRRIARRQRARGRSGYVFSTPDEARAVARGLAVSGVDVIKVVFDSGRTAEGFGRGLVPVLGAPVLRALAEEGRAAAIPVTVHWGNISELQRVIEARRSSLEHAAGYAAMPEQMISSIAAAHIDVDATLTVLAAHLPPDVLRDGPFANVRELTHAGVTINAGTDAPLRRLKLGESLHRELELLVEAGLSTTQALSAATSRSRPAHVPTSSRSPAIQQIRSLRCATCTW
jgi:imidazolonepropionase-like amidohydrolase